MSGVLLQDTGQAKVAKLAHKSARIIVHGCALHQHVAALQVTCTDAFAESGMLWCMGPKAPLQERPTVLVLSFAQCTAYVYTIPDKRMRTQMQS